MSELKLTARIESSSSTHTVVGVFQNGGKAGVLHVDVEHAEAIIEILETGGALKSDNARLRAACKRVLYARGSYEALEQIRAALAPEAGR